MVSCLSRKIRVIFELKISFSFQHWSWFLKLTARLGSSLVENPVHEVIERVPLVVVAGLAVEVSEVGAGKVGPVFLDELEEEGVLGALEADRAKRRQPKQQFGKPENGAKILRQGSLT